jgi:hypothetical protein
MREATFVLFAVIVLVLLGLAWLGVILDSFTTEAERADYCRRHASTPYDYHRC